MNQTKVDFANTCALARENPGCATLIEYDREVMFVSDGENEFYLYFDTKVWHEHQTIHQVWEHHQKSLQRTPPR